MHRLPSQAALIRFRVSAYLFILGAIVTLGSVGFLIYGVSVGHRNFIVLASSLVGVGIFLFIFQWMIASRARCPLCLTPSLSAKGCSKHRNAKSLFGSHRLRVATSIMFTNSFRCPYCNEPTALEVRQRRNQ